MKLFDSLTILGFVSVVSSFSWAQAVSKEVVITMGGDVAFARTAEKPQPDKALVKSDLSKSLAKSAQIKFVMKSWEELTHNITDFPTGDLNFLNIETVISDRTDLTIYPKGYNFVSHPNSIRQLISMGFNLFSTANNHSYDYGIQGFNETVKYTQILKSEYPGVYISGVGANISDALHTEIVPVKDYRFGFLASGFLESESFRPKENRAGQMNIRNKEDFKSQLSSLMNSGADFKILSVHDGIEREVIPSDNEKRKYQSALNQGVDLVIGHHPHVVRPIERIGDKLIIHSLGNFILLGGANINRAETDKNYGIFVKVYLNEDAKSCKPVVQAIEVYPLRDMHDAVKRLDPNESRIRIEALNKLAKKMGPTGVQLKVRASDGAGIACFGNNLGPQAAELCKGL